jgi:ABC-type multidrug transport system ATPase subunit/pSer/pThr/pTyr-binding forkhead associated (FHA) protein
MLFARLKLYDGTLLQDVFLITTRNRFTIGRDRANTLFLPDPKLLPFHGVVYWNEKQFVVQRCHPSARLWCNGSLLKSDEAHPLRDGDRIQLGATTLEFDLSPSVASPSPLPSSLPATQASPITSHHRLQVISPDWIQEYPLRKQEIWIGSDAGCDICLEAPSITPHHLKLTWNEEGYRLENHAQDERLTCQGQAITRRLLLDGDVLSLEPTVTFKYSVLSPQEQTSQIEAIPLRNRARVGFGRDPRNDVVLDHPMISRFHATLEWQAGSWYIKDLNSSNGTFVNEQSVQQSELHVGDTLHIGAYEFQLSPEETLVQCTEAGKLRLDACHLIQTIASGAHLLEDISLSILPEEFVTIVGVSGAGKSTLLNALSGFRPATRGSVFVNGHNLYKHFDAYRTELGYVPQDDIIHPELTVRQALDFAAQLRLPPDISATERRRQVFQVLRDLELEEQIQTPVRNLSGGQRKRVSIGVELLTKPGLFFLDEATSGLDPGTELQMMRLLRRLADQGRTVILVTHTTKNLMLSDLVVFLAKGGQVAFFGPPKQALSYFEVNEVDEIYIKLEEERSPQEWADDFRASPYYQTYVLHRQAGLNIDLSERSQQNPRPAPQKSSDTSSWRQFQILSRRNLTILKQDRSSLIALLMIPFILGALDFVMWRKNMFDVTAGDPSQCFTLMFITVLIAVLVGGLATMRDIVREAEIYRRERMIGLKVLPYLLSKVWFSAVLAFYQAAIFLGTKALAVDLPGDFRTLLSMYFTVFLATLGGMVMGLLVSALSPTQNLAPLLTILFLVPQIMFAGSFLPLSSLGAVGQGISELTVTRWSYESMVTLSGVGKSVAKDPCWQNESETRQKGRESEKNQCICMGPQLFKQCYFPGLRQEYDSAVDQPEPIKPKDPGDPPPSNDFTANPQGYLDDLDRYTDQAKTYREDIDKWQDSFGRWKEQRGRAIAAGEELLSRFRKNQGHTYAVTVPFHWLRLGIMNGVMLVILFVVQKRKDWI